VDVVSHFWFVRIKSIGRQPRDEISDEVHGTSMACVIEVQDILELMKHRFNERAFPEENALGEFHDLRFHVLSQLGNQFETLFEKVFKKFLRNESLVSE